MSAAKTRLTKYLGKDGAVVYAAKITAILPYQRVLGARTLKFGDLGKQSHLIPEWLAAHNPQVGGYFVVYDLPDGQAQCRYESAESIARHYTKAEA